MQRANQKVQKLEGIKVTNPVTLLDLYQLGDFEYQYRIYGEFCEVKICNTVYRRDVLARKVCATIPITVRMRRNDTDGN